jgi:hypothetical protein
MARYTKYIANLLIIYMLIGCEYQKGDMYSSTLTGDSLNYLIMAKGSGEKISQRASYEKLQHEYKGNSCQIKYITDSIKLSSQKGILLFNSSLPNIEEDILSKGFFGTFSSKQQVVLLLVSYPDFEKSFLKTTYQGE